MELKKNYWVCYTWDRVVGVALLFFGKLGMVESKECVTTSKVPQL